MTEQIQGDVSAPAIADAGSVPSASNVAHSEPSSVGTSHEVSANDTHGELSANDGQEPEWLKRRLGRQEKKYERTIAELKGQIDELRGFSNPNQSVYGAQVPVQPAANQSTIYDPASGQYIDVNSDKGRILQTIEQREYAQKAQVNWQSQQQARQAFLAEQKRLEDAMLDSFDEAEARHQDFRDVVFSDNVPFTKDIREALQMSHNPGELAYYLASNPKEVQRLSKLHPLQMVREINRHAIEMSRKPISKAPPPIQPVTEAAVTTPNKSFSKMSYQEMKAARREEARGRFKR